MFNSICHKLELWYNSSAPCIELSGTTSAQWSLYHGILTNNTTSILSKSNNLIICPSPEIAENIYQTLKPGNTPVHYFPGLEISPYSEVIPSHQNVIDQFRLINLICQTHDPINIVCTFDAYLLLLPTKSFFLDHSFSINISDIIPPLKLSEKLVSLGYSPTTTVEEPGTFTRKGEIFDVFPVSGPPIRINYFDEMIEKIYFIDTKTNRTIPSNETNFALITPAPGILSTNCYANNFKNNIPIPEPKYQKRYLKRKDIFSKLNQNTLFENYPNLLTAFLDETCTISDYFDKKNTIITIIESNNTHQEVNSFKEKLHLKYNESIENIDFENIILPPEKIFDFSVFEKQYSNKIINVNSVSLLNLNYNEQNFDTQIKIETCREYISKKTLPTSDRHDYIKNFLASLKEDFKHRGEIIFATTNDKSKKELEYLLDLYEYPSEMYKRISFTNLNSEEGFFYPLENEIIIAEADLFSRKKSITSHSKTTKNLDLFAEKISTLQAGDFVIHDVHGLGKYLGLETIEMDSNKTDYILIEYTNNDKIYVPIYKINLIQKHADATANLKPNSLRSTKFLLLKQKAKKDAKKLAFDLIKLQAERETSKAFAFSEPDHLYKEFELAFPFSETLDQQDAIESVLKKMQLPKPMDFLVCGDVGFGKTEVAMRAAFKAVLDKKQVAILVPTTILAIQHYSSFITRFKNFPVIIDFLSRFKSPKETKEVKEKLQLGQIDIIIGTHKLLGSSIKFKDLGLVIVDEEHRFGVGHKEKLKLLKSSMDFLTLTATPIPRTLQLSFLGIKDLSLIQTAPPKRQSIKTYIMRDDDKTIKEAIQKEMARGGQVFFVHNRVQDIDRKHAYLQELVPDASIVVAHGQLPEKQLEQKIKAFYEGKYQILLSTTIIESGIDIPNANTMIINKANNFGLAQLHQLRGRVGRSDKKAYAYFIIPKHSKISVEAEKRLLALKTYADIGSGFSLASCDLEIRGAGNILGADQSGHIQNVGLELYMELLKEAISEIKGEKRNISKNVEISTPYNSYIPNYYIKDSSARLKYYKKLANCENLENLNDLISEIENIFGICPTELENLFSIIKIKINLQACAVKSLQVSQNTLIICFDKNILENNTELRDIIVKHFLSRPKIYKFTQDFKVIYNTKNSFNRNELVKFSKELKNILEQGTKETRAF